jgi:CheY-like chemotaxis protein
MITDLAATDVASRVLIVDDAASTRRFLRGVLEHSRQFEVAGEAANGASAVEMAEALQPDVVLLDLSMPLTDGATALSGLLRVAPNALVIVLSGVNPERSAPLLAAGASGFIPKGLAPYELLERLGRIVGRPVSVQPAPPSEERSADTDAGLVRPRAVICDDDATSRRLVGRVLENCGVSVVAETDSVPHLLTVVGLAKPELLVLDLWLEGTTGTTAIPEIAEISPDTFVIVYSAYVEWKVKALAAGAAAFVAKPDFDELEAHIRRAVPALAT